VKDNEFKSLGGVAPETNFDRQSRSHSWSRGFDSNSLHTLTKKTVEEKN